MKIRIEGLPEGTPAREHPVIWDRLEGDTVVYRYAHPAGQIPVSSGGISLRTAPCGNQDPHRAHTYGDRGHTCLGLTTEQATRPGKRIELKRDRRPHEGYDYELHITPEGGNTTVIERLTNADLDELRRVIARPQATSPDAMHREGDVLVGRLGPDAHLVTDASTCIVLITPERRITVSNVDEWKAMLDTSRTFAQIHRDEAETRHRDEKQAATHMYAGHIAGLRDRDQLIDHLHRSPDHDGGNTDAQLASLQEMTTLGLIKEHQREHGLR